MARNPTPHVDRLADAETGLALVNRELASRAHRRAQLGTFLQLWAAETRETEAGTYPRYDDTDSDQLPVVTLESSLTGGVLSWEDRSEWPLITAYSPVGWLPPLTRVEIGWDGKRYRIVQAPARLHGRSDDKITAADWGSYLGYADACRQLNLGSGEIHVFTESSPGVLVPQYYTDDSSAVLLRVYNTSREVDADKLLTVDRDRHNRWVVTIDPCDLACSES